MKFSKSLSIIVISVQTLLINAENVTFKCMAVNGTPYVTVDGQQFEMTLDKYPLYKTKVEVDKFPVEYNYGVLYDDGNAEQEEFVRKREKDEKAVNEFFNRSVTLKEHPLLPKAYESFEYYEPSKLFDDNHVATIIIETDPTALQNLYLSPSDELLKIDAKVIYASPYTVKTFNQAILSISGQSTRGVPKLSYKIKNLNTEDNKELYGRTAIKLRAEHMDPSFLRDKIYGDILNTLGAPTAQNKFARLFINGEAVGLFDLADDVSNGRYLRETYNKGEKYTEEIPIFKADYCASCLNGPLFGDLGYYGENIYDPKYGIYTYKGDDETIDSPNHVGNELIPLLREINAYYRGTSNEMSLDTDTFLKFMVMEYFGGAVDNYWNKPGNYFIFKDPAKNKWYFQDADFHFSFGVGGDPINMLNTPIAQYPANADVNKFRPPLDAIRSKPENEAKFKEMFDRLLKTSFHKEALFPRIDSLVELIREDVQWDFTIPRVNQAQDQHDTDLIYTYEDFVQHTTSLKSFGKYETYPLKFFINIKIKRVATELNIAVPAKFETDLGFVENPDSKGNKDSSASIKSLNWSLFSAFMVLFLTYALI